MRNLKQNDKRVNDIIIALNNLIEHPNQPNGSALALISALGRDHAWYKTFDYLLKM
ncbi:MAG: hypothetical protein LBU88_06210 [Treponema sp.]|nr:hypothetical protein [Treponema sp.]